MAKNKTKPDPIQQDMAALERATLKMAEYYDDTTIHGLINCIMRGWIRNGRFTEEYRELARQAERNRAEGEAAEQRVQNLRESILGMNSSTGGITSG